MADVGQIILQAAQGIVQQNQNNQRLAMQAAQLGMQLQQAERTFQLQREELDMRKQMMEHKEEQFELEKRRVTTGERQAAVAETHADIAKEKQAMFKDLNTLMLKTDIQYKQVEIQEKLNALQATDDPTTAAKKLLTASPGLGRSLQKDIMGQAKQAAVNEFLANGRVTIGGQTIDRPQNMAVYSEEEVYRNLGDIDRTIASMTREYQAAKSAAISAAGKDTRSARQMRERFQSLETRWQQLHDEKRGFNEYATAYSRLNAAQGDKAWQEIAAYQISAGNPHMKDLMLGMGVMEAQGITTPGGITLYTPSHRLRYIGGGVGTTKGKFENYKTETGTTYAQRFNSCWDLFRKSEPGANAWDSGMSIMKSLSRDKFENDAEALAFVQCVRVQWGVDSTNPKEEASFRRAMQAFLDERGVRKAK